MTETVFNLTPYQLQVNALIPKAVKVANAAHQKPELTGEEYEDAAFLAIFNAAWSGAYHGEMMRLTRSEGLRA